MSKISYNFSTKAISFKIHCHSLPVADLKHIVCRYIATIFFFFLVQVYYVYKYMQFIKCNLATLI